MAIINRSGFPILSTFDNLTKPTFAHSTIVWNMRNFDDADYYYCEYKTKDTFDIIKLDDVVNPDIKHNIKSGQCFLMMVNFHECFPNTIEPLIKHLVIQNEIPPQQIILGSGNPDMIQEVRRVSQKLGVEEIKVEWFLELEYAAQEQLTQPHYNRVGVRIPTLEHKSYPKTFLNLNRRWRMHRPTMIALLANKNLLDKGYISLGKSDDNNDWEKVFWGIKEFNLASEEITKILNEYEPFLKSMPDLYLDTEDLVTNRSFFDFSSHYLYENTLFSLVSETNFYTNPSIDSVGRFITEKTFKCIGLEHPFLLITTANSLPLLHQLGYKTFHPYIDESYDQEPNDHKRLLKIVDEVERLCNLSDSEIEIFINECRKIVVHNRENLLSKTHFTYKMN